jgi:hypothetical protein
MNTMAIEGWETRFLVTARPADDWIGLPGRTHRYTCRHCGQVYLPLMHPSTDRPTDAAIADLRQHVCRGDVWLAVAQHGVRS